MRRAVLIRLVAASLSIPGADQRALVTDEGDSVPRVSYEEYLVAVALTLARRHRPVWSWRKWRRICRCGADLPCHARHRIPINRGHWPGEEAQ